MPPPPAVKARWDGPKAGTGRRRADPELLSGGREAGPRSAPARARDRGRESRAADGTPGRAGGASAWARPFEIPGAIEGGTGGTDRAIPPTGSPPSLPTRGYGWTAGPPGRRAPPAAKRGPRGGDRGRPRRPDEAGRGARASSDGPSGNGTASGPPDHPPSLALGPRTTGRCRRSGSGRPASPIRVADDTGLAEAMTGVIAETVRGRPRDRPPPLPGRAVDERAGSIRPRRSAASRTTGGPDRGPRVVPPGTWLGRMA